MTLCSYSLSFILLMSSVLSGNFLFLITVQCFNVMLNLCYSYTCLLFDLINIFETFFHCEHLAWFIGWHNNSNFYLSLLLDLSISLVFNPSCICINYKNLFIQLSNILRICTDSSTVYLLCSVQVYSILLYKVYVCNNKVLLINLYMHIIK